MDEEAKFRRKLMVKESDTWVAVAIAAAVAPTAVAQRRSLVEENVITSEVPLEVMSITLRFAGLSKEEIIRIFHNKFKAINLYQLYYIKGLYFDII